MVKNTQNDQNIVYTMVLKDPKTKFEASFTEEQMEVICDALWDYDDWDFVTLEGTNCVVLIDQKTNTAYFMNAINTALKDWNIFSVNFDSAYRFMREKLVDPYHMGQKKNTYTYK